MLSQLQDLYREYLEAHPFRRDPEELYLPADYILSLGGKRLRPVIVLLGYQLFRDDVRRALPVAHAVEVFHNFSLVHDDIMDQAPLRRGRPTVHHRYDVNTAILSGDVMLIYAYEYLLRFEDPAAVRLLVAAFNRVAIEVCEGQQLDMNFEKRQDVEIGEYLRMIELKTAALIGGSLELGALAAGADPESARMAAAFGRNIGIAFQLQDDLLDTFGDPEKFGKKVGGDIAQNKKTFLVLKALEVAAPETKRTLLAYLTTSETDEKEKIARVTQIFRELDIPNLTAGIKDQYRKEALRALGEIGVAEERKKALYEMAEMLVSRDL